VICYSHARGFRPERGGLSSPADRKDFQTEQEIRWCPGCGDYSILAQCRRSGQLGHPAQKSYSFPGSLFFALPYYVKRNGVHGIHGRAPPLPPREVRQPGAFGLGGDGRRRRSVDRTNHLIHCLRRNGM